MCLAEQKQVHDYLQFFHIIAGSFKSQLIDYFRGCIVSWEKVEGSIWQFYDN